VTLSRSGRGLLRTVTQRRRKELRSIIGELEPAAQRQLITAFERFAQAAGEIPDQAWKLGWTA
jgi:hypothetical protein